MAETTHSTSYVQTSLILTIVYFTLFSSGSALCSISKKNQLSADTD